MFYKLKLSCFVLLLSACVKQIPFDINTNNRKMVIEGYVNNIDTTATVIISETVNLSTTEPPPSVSGARVAVTDVTSNTTFLLSEWKPGNYIAKSFKGYPGHEYFLQVQLGNNTYEARSQMPLPVKLDSIAFLDMSLFGLNKYYHTILYFQDPYLSDNYYRYLQKVNGIERNTIYVFDDIFTNGNYQSVELYKTDLLQNDTVSVEMQCIDKSTYQYFKQIGNVDQVSGQQSLTPTNPVTNITGGAIGYFSAYCKQTKNAVIK